MILGGNICTLQELITTRTNGEFKLTCEVIEVIIMMPGQLHVGQMQQNLQPDWIAAEFHKTQMCDSHKWQLQLGWR